MSNVENYIDSKLNESSWSRIIQHIEGNNNFAVISAYQKANTEQQNWDLHYKLESDIRKLGFGYIMQSSGYSYVVPQTGGKKSIAKEYSFFIPKIDYDNAMKLSIEYKQESFLYKDNDKFALVYAKDVISNEGKHFKKGDIELTFKSKKDKEGKITFDPEVLKYAYSALLKANKSQQGKSFAYVVESIEEIIYPSRADCMAKRNYVTWRKIF